MKSTSIIYTLLLLIGVLNSCGQPTTDSAPTSTTPSLSEHFLGDFLIGTALGSEHLKGTDTAANQLITSQFNALTPENDMKWMHIHPGPDSFNFELPDRLVQLATEHNMLPVGHTLVWHSQLADWVGEVKDSSAMAQVIQHHIAKIVGRYKGRIKAWDVVNEALNEDGTLRSSVFLNAMGEAYIEEAFRQAALADPAAALIYNDYNMCNPEKRAGVIRLAKNLQEKGIKMDGIGMQGHWNLVSPSLEEIENSILAYAALGLKVHISELDITVLPNPWDLEGAAVEQKFSDFIGDERMNPYAQALPDSVQTQLADRYEAIFRLFLKHRDKIDRVTFWGVHDGHTWLNNWPIPGRTNYPLLFDRQYQPKVAYDRLLQLQ